MDSLLVELKQEPEILHTPEENPFSGDSDPVFDQENTDPEVTEEPESEENSSETPSETSTPESEPTLSDKDDNAQQSETSEKSEKQPSQNNDAYIAKLLEKLIKERDRLVELGILMTQGDSTSKRNSLPNVQPREIKSNQENLDPSEEVPVQKSKRRQPSVIPDIKVPQNPKYQVEEKEISQEEEDAKQQKAKLAKLKNYKFEELLHITRKDANFGNNLPGQIVEEALEIINKSNENLVVEILIDCLNPELQDTDEYVYSIRRSHAYDYNDKHYLIMAPFSSASFRLALKVPAAKLVDNIRGSASIGIQGVNGKSVLKMMSNVIIPKVFCPRELFYKPLKTNIVKVAVKQGKKLETKIPLKNSSEVPITLDLEFHRNKELAGSKFDCYVYPTSVTIPAGGMTIVTLMLKYLGGSFKDEKEVLKRALIGKARDCAVTYSFLLWIETY